jgi:tetratricopeptide (TPR) repeat protein
MINSNDADAYYNSGLTYYESGQYHKAIDDYTKAIELNPEDAKAYVGRGCKL